MVAAGRVLKGEVPAQMPVVQSVLFLLPSTFRPHVDLGIEVPPTLVGAQTR
jgi:hypothetical protein